MKEDYRMNKKSTKRSLLFSVLALILCCALLAGTTLAWFTDTASSGINRIVAGNLDVELYHTNGEVTNKNVKDETKLFRDKDGNEMKWEPGAYAYEKFTVKNEGTLALKYKMAINVGSFTSYEGHNLTEVLRVMVLPDGTIPTERPSYGRTGESLSTWKYTGANTYTTLYPEEVALTDPTKPSESTFTVVIYWEPTDHDNDYNMNNGRPSPLSIDLGIQLEATQMENESDSFGPDYDKDADVSVDDAARVDNAMSSTQASDNGSAKLTAPAAPSLSQSKKMTTAKFPENSFEPGDKVEIRVNTENTSYKAMLNNSQTVATLDVSLYVNGVETHRWYATEGLTEDEYPKATVTTYITTGYGNNNVVICDENGDELPTTYDSDSGELTFQTTHFSVFQSNTSLEESSGEKVVAVDKVNDVAYIDLKTAIIDSAKENTDVTLSNQNTSQEIQTAIDQAIAETEDTEAPITRDDVSVVLPDNGTSEPDTSAFEATVGGKHYATLAGAIKAAGSGKTVTLLKNVHLPNTITIEEGTAVTLDLNGKAITVDTRPGDSTRHYYAIDNYGVFTLIDSSAEQTGSITARGIENLGSGKMTVNGGTIISCDDNGGAAIWNDANLTVNGGTFKTDHVGAPSDGVGVGCLNNSGTALITGGTFNDVNRRTYAIISTGNINITPAEGKQVLVSGAHGGLAIDSGTAVVNGGSYSSTEYYGLYVSNDGDGTDPMRAEVTVNGGSFTGANYSVWIGSDYNDPVNSTISITGGTFEKPLNAQVCTQAGAIVVSGGKFKADPTDYLASGYKATSESDGYFHVAESTEWKDHAAASYATHVDDVNKIVTIASAEELALFGNEVSSTTNYSGYTVNITENIDLGGYTWQPINGWGRMSDITFDGNGHTISNMVIKSNFKGETGGFGVGFVGNTNGAITWNDLTFDKADVSFYSSHAYSGNVGGVVMGYTYGTTVFNNVSVTNSTIYGYGKIGALLGMGADPGVKVTFTNCTSKDNTIAAVYDMGGLAGLIQRKNGTDYTNIKNCTVENINLKTSQWEEYVDLNNVQATFKSNDKSAGADTPKSITGKYWVSSGYYWGGYADYYVSYGNSEYDAPITTGEHTGKCIANSEICININK